MRRFDLSNYYIWLFVLLAIPYILGLSVPLMDSDSAHHANIALRMFLTGDYVNLIDRGADYLDKPHLHFWLAAFCYHVLGVSTIAYKLPSFFFTVLGTYATYKLGRKLYNKDSGVTAALIFLSAQASILANNDVRMDALLTACIVFAVWQLTECATTAKWYNFLLASLGLAAGFATKGMVGFVTPCVALFFWLIYERNWKMMFNLRWLIVFALWFVFILPVLFCYYFQFDLHPEKVVRGMKQISGVRFILWHQNSERLEGSHWGKENTDHLFFFHTMLWAFLPWCLLTYHVLYKKIVFFIKYRFARFQDTEFLCLGTIILLFTVISSSNFKLPHYLNILFPFFAIITAGWLVQIREEGRRALLKGYLYLQCIVTLICLAIAISVNTWFFPISSVFLVALAGTAVIVALILTIRERTHFSRILIISVFSAVFSNIVLNGNFYPKLLTYQAGIGLSKIAQIEHISVKDVCFFQEHSFSFDFYNAHLCPILQLPEIKDRLKRGGHFWIYTGESGMKKLKLAGIKMNKVLAYRKFKVSRLKFRFLNPATRQSTLTKNYLIEV